MSGAFESGLGEALGSRVVATRPVGGGCISDAALVELEDGRRLFLKVNAAAPPDLFEREAEGLAAIEGVGRIRVPRGARAGTAAGTPFIAMEAVVAGRPGGAFSARFGRRLAEFHRAAAGQRYGFAHDNYLGSTPQPNAWSEDWCGFWRRHRLGFQLELARSGGRSDRELERLGARLMESLDRWLGAPQDPPCLLHGDLWGGNYLVAADDGEPVLVDPACYYGQREAELAMTRLFGGFDAAFYGAYEEVWPLAPESADRLAIYELYHLLNHLNLFGGSYRAGCIARLRRLVGAGTC